MTNINIIIPPLKTLESAINVSAFAGYDKCAIIPENMVQVFITPDAWNGLALMLPTGLKFSYQESKSLDKISTSEQRGPHRHSHSVRLLNPA